MAGVPITALVNSLIGVSARRLRQRYQIRTNRDHLWPPSHLAATCGSTLSEITQQYVQQQRTRPLIPA